MSHHQKHNPVHDSEAITAHPTSPLAQSGSFRSEHGDPSQDPLNQRPQRLVPLAPPKKRGRNRCCNCLCDLLILIVLVGAPIGILYLVFKPKQLDYSIDRLQLTRFALNQNSSLAAAFNVTITATNPNKKIGIYYEDRRKLTVWYKKTQLSNGSLPKFYQGHENTTVIHVEMTGETQDAASLITTLKNQQITGSIPLTFKVSQPVRIKVGKLKLLEVRFLIICEVYVDDLATDKEITIQNSGCKIKPML